MSLCDGDLGGSNIAGEFECRLDKTPRTTSPPATCISQELESRQASYYRPTVARALAQWRAPGILWILDEINVSHSTHFFFFRLPRAKFFSVRLWTHISFSCLAVGDCEIRRCRAERSPDR